MAVTFYKSYKSWPQWLSCVNDFHILITHEKVFPSFIEVLIWMPGNISSQTKEIFQRKTGFQAVWRQLQITSKFCTWIQYRYNYKSMKFTRLQMLQIENLYDYGNLKILGFLSISGIRNTLTSRVLKLFLR